MVGLFCTLLRNMYEITLLGDKLTVSIFIFMIRTDTLNILCMTAHINNLYNTAFWSLVQQGGQSTTEAHSTLRVSRLPYLYPKRILRLAFLTREHFRKINMKSYILGSGSITTALMPDLEKEVFCFVKRLVPWATLSFSLRISTAFLYPD